MLFDRRCPGCGRGARTVCGSCWGLLTANTVPPDELESMASRLGLDSLSASFPYDLLSRRVILMAKNGGRRELLHLFAAHLATSCPADISAVTWVPASRRMRRRRGFDQGQVLARAIGSILEVRPQRLLVRSGGRTQAGGTRAQRLQGPDLAADGVSAQHVLVVDDVLTTGASLAVASTVLRAAGADRVHGAVVAFVPGPPVARSRTTPPAA